MTTDEWDYVWRGGDANLGGNLGLVGLLRVVGGNTLSLDALGLLIDLVVRAEKVDLIVVLFSSSLCGGRFGTKESLAGGAGAGEGAELGLVGLDVVVPAGYAGEGGIGGRADRLENGDIGLGRGVSGERKSA